MEAFEREILRYENASGDVVSDALRIGIVLRQLEETKLKEYLPDHMQNQCPKGKGKGGKAKGKDKGGKGKAQCHQCW
eukprot:4518118-Amphidinium_carterae.1